MTTSENESQYLLLGNEVKKGQKMFAIDILSNSCIEVPILEEKIIARGNTISVKKVKLEPYMAYIPAINKEVAIKKFTNRISKAINK